MKETFDKYLENFDMNNPKIKHKYLHSIEVMEVMEKYCDILKLSQTDKKLATLIGLLHDFGRFKQLELYDSFEDLKTMDHADYSAVILFDEKYIEFFWSNEEDYDLIKFAIVNHNKKNIEKTSDERYLFFAKLIRDIDKLVIFKNCVNDVTSDITNDIISEKVVNAFRNKTLVDYKDVNNINEQWACLLAYLYDINFKEVFLELKEEYNKILSRFNNKFDEIIKIIKDDLERMN